SQWRGGQERRAGLDPLVGAATRQCFGDRVVVQMRAGGKVGHRHAVDQAQCVEHVFERQLVGGDQLGAVGARRVVGGVQVGARVASLPAPVHAAGGIGQFAVGAGADAEVVAELPVV